MRSPKATFILTTGTAGSGKTYVRGPRFICDELLPETEKVHCSNLPLNFDEIAEFVAAKTGKQAYEYRDRLKAIPKEVLENWAAERSGPWDYFRDISIDGWHIAIDESHNYCGSRHSANHRKQWQVWLGELRHRGAQCEFLSQDQAKLAPEVVKEAGALIQVSNSEDRLDPFFKIPLSEWYELRAKFVTGVYESVAWEQYGRKSWGRFVTEQEKKWAYDAKYFALYDSYNTPHGGGVKAKGATREHEKRTRVGLLKWFFRRNVGALVSRFVLASAVVWVCFLGGFQWGLKAFMEKLSGSVGNSVAASAMPGSEMAAAKGKVPPIGSPTLADPVATASELRKELNERDAAMADVKSKLEAAEKAVEELKEKLAAGSGVVAMGGDWVQFENGDVYRVGQTVADGLYVGQSLASIDWERRRANFSGGESATLGHKAVTRASSDGWQSGVLTAAREAKAALRTGPAWPTSPDAVSTGDGLSKLPAIAPKARSAAASQQGGRAANFSTGVQGDIDRAYDDLLRSNLGEEGFNRVRGAAARRVLPMADE